MTATRAPIGATAAPASGSASNALQLIAVMALWAACFPLITIGLASSPHITFAAMRAALAGAALVAVGLVLGRPLPSTLAAWGSIALIGLGATTLGFLGMVHAAEFVGPGIATVIANTQPLLAAVIAYVFLGERLGRSAYGGLALGFLGIVLIAAPRMFDSATDTYFLGIAYLLLAALGITFSNVLIKHVSDTVDAIMAMGWQLMLGAVPLAVAAWAWEVPASIQWSPQFILVLGGLGLGGTALPYWLWFSVLKTMELGRANAYTFLVPLIGLVIGVALFDEQLGPYAAAGAGLAIVGTWLAQVFGRLRR